mgnify:CR=1 FL=1
MGMQNLGLTLGNLCSVGILYTITNMISPYYGFALMGFLFFLWVCIIYFFKLIQEPSVMTDKEARRQGRKSFCGKIYSMLKQTAKACK